MKNTSLTKEQFIAMMHDALMEQIEPDLCSYNLVTLAQKYKDETPPQTRIRMERYQKAYDQFFAMWDEYQTMCKGMLHDLSSQALKLLKKRDMEHMEELEDAFDDPEE